MFESAFFAAMIVAVFTTFQVACRIHLCKSGNTTEKRNFSVPLGLSLISWAALISLIKYI